MPLRQRQRGSNFILEYKIEMLVRIGLKLMGFYNRSATETRTVNNVSSLLSFTMDKFVLAPFVR